MKNQRRHYRVDPRSLALRGLLQLPTGRDHLAEVVDLSARGMRLLLTDAAAPRRGETVRIRMFAPQMKQPVNTVATVVHADTTPQSTVVGLEIRDWIGLRESLPAALQPAFNLRSSYRYQLEGADCAVLIGGIWMYFETDGLIRDISDRGVGFTAQPTEENHMRLASEVRLQFLLPGDDREFDLRGQVCRRASDGGSTRYGTCLLAADEPEVRRQLLRIRNWIERQQQRETPTVRRHRRRYVG